VTVLAGSAAGVFEDLRRLRRANVELAELHGAETERIALLERARLAREIHDGIAQELWLARLTTGRLAESTDLRTEDRKIVNRLDGILDRALAEARQAVVTLQPTSDERFGELLHRYVDDYADHFGMDIECSIKTDASPEPHAQAELLRICREALNNARKHADATRVEVTLGEDAGSLMLSVWDNGAGFNPAQTTSGFGLQSMRDRAQALGAQLDLQSAPMDGTKVAVRLPAVSA